MFSVGDRVALRGHAELREGVVHEVYVSGPVVSVGVTWQGGRLDGYRTGEWPWRLIRDDGAGVCAACLCRIDDADEREVCGPCAEAEDAA
ncbi:MAG: hypothetical protein AB7G65_19325 [Thermoleophilia bacterium]